MAKSLAGAVALLLVVSISSADESLCRIASHGCSGTVFYTGPSKTHIISCAHGWEDRPVDPARRVAVDNRRFFRDHRGRVVERMLNVPITVDGPRYAVGATGTGKARVAKIDYKLDLCWIIVDAGPVTAYRPVASRGVARGAVTVSRGYDSMRYPMTSKNATILATRGPTTFTREIPYPGRSGGPILDSSGRIVGVVSGYDSNMHNEPLYGVYISHAAILHFLWGRRASNAEPLKQFDARPNFHTAPPAREAVRRPAPRVIEGRQPCPPGGL